MLDERCRIVSTLGKRNLKPRIWPAQFAVGDARVREGSNRGWHECDAEAGRDEADDRLRVVRLLDDPGAETRRAAHGEDVVVEPGAMLSEEEDERLRRQSFDGHAGEGGERMRIGKRRDELFLDEGRQPQRRVIDRRTHEADVDASGMECGDLRACRQLLEAELDVGKALTEGAQDRRQRDVARRADEADRQPAHLARAGSAKQLFDPIGLREQRAATLEQQAPGVRQLHTTAVAAQEHDAELLLEPLDLLAQRGLGDAQALRGTPEVQLLGDGDEVAKTTKFQLRRCRYQTEFTNILDVQKLVPYVAVMAWAMEAFVFTSARISAATSVRAGEEPRVSRRVWVGASRRGDVISVEAVVVGAGQAGLAVSRELLARGIDHVVLERGRVGETWRSQRWDSFVLNTPVWMNQLPGSSLTDPDPSRFPTGREFVEALECYVGAQALPVHESVDVTAVEAAAGSYLVTTSAGCYRSRSLIVATGIQRAPKVPAFARALPASITQMHVARYRSPDALPPGAVVVVGSGQSGCQIAEELLEAGRRVYLATSRVGRLPRRYCGRDVLEWRCEMGFYEQTPAMFDEYESLRAPMPITSGVRGGHTLSLQQFARDGAILLGRLDGVAGARLRFADDLAENVRFGDQFAAEVRRSIDEYMRRNCLDAPPADDDPAEAPEPGVAMNTPRVLDLRATGVGTILWATGFGGDFGWLPEKMLDGNAVPAHRRGIGRSPGLCAVGFPWLSKRKSGIVYGVGEDASRIATEVASRAATPPAGSLGTRSRRSRGMSVYTRASDSPGRSTPSSIVLQVSPEATGSAGVSVPVVTISPA